MTVPSRLAVGCYTTASPAAIHVFDVDGPRLAGRTQVTDVDHASFLAAHPDGATLYAVSETVDHGAVVAYRVDPSDASLTRIDRVPSHGAAPCHLSTDGRHLYVANYGSGTIAAYALRPDGRFGPLVGRRRHRGSGPHERQDGPHAHCIVSAPDGRSLYATDLGTDRIERYVHDAGELRAAGSTDMEPGAGPRHLTFHPDHPIAFAVCELTNTLVTLDVDRETDLLNPRSSASTLPDDFAGASIAAEVCVHPAGRRIYVSNRGHDSIATYAFDDPDDAPTLIGHVSSGGRTPRHIAVDPSGATLFAANQDSDTIVAFSIDDMRGLPEPIGVAARVSRPVCLTFLEGPR